MSSERYRQYMKSRQWHQLKMRKFLRDGGLSIGATLAVLRGDGVPRGCKVQCGKCGEFHPIETIEVHHRTYDRVYRESLDDLVILCASCHSTGHRRPERLGRGISKLF